MTLESPLRLNRLYHEAVFGHVATQRKYHIAQSCAIFNSTQAKFMITRSGCNIVHVSDLPWEEHIRFGGNKIRTKTYWHDTDKQLLMRLIDQPSNAIVPRHMHSGTHVTTILKGCARVNGLTLNALDVIVGPSNEPHGPLAYPDGCQLFSCFQGGDDHTAAPSLAAGEHYRLIQSEAIPWSAKAGGALQMKTLVDNGAGQLQLTAMRLSAGFTVPMGSRPHLQAALIVDGAAVIDGETLNALDFMVMAAGVPHGPIHFPDGATLLMVAMRTA